MNDIICRITDIRAVHFCARGARAWFQRHGLDYQDFLVNGIEVSKVEALNDGLGNMVAQHARKAAETEIENGR